MYKYYVKVSYPDLHIISNPEAQAVFTVYANSSEKAAARGYHWGVAIVKDIMRHIQVNPYEIDLVAPELVKVVSVRLWVANEAKNHNVRYGSETQPDFTVALNGSEMPL